jgi:hypothetical protein
VLALLAAGCTTTGYNLVVVNAGDAPIRDVEVRTDGALRYAATTIDADQYGTQRRTDEGLPAVSELRWKDSSGKLHTQKIDAGKPLPQGFKGRVVFQIKGTTIRVFTQAAEAGSGSDIPWGFDDRVDGTSSMPGMPGSRM